MDAELNKIMAKKIICPWSRVRVAIVEFSLVERTMQVIDFCSTHQSITFIA
jgi:hypothetical protein